MEENASTSKNPERSLSLDSTFQIEFADFINFRRRSIDEDNWENVLDDDVTSKEDKLTQKSADRREIPINTLTEDEQEVVLRCQDPELKQLLILNRRKKTQLLCLQKKVLDNLEQCRNLLKEEKVPEEEEEEASANEPQTMPCIPTYKLAAPYFKTSNYYASPYNTDVTERKGPNKELSPYCIRMPMKWRSQDLDKLESAVKCNYNINRQNAVVDKLQSLKKKLEDADDEHRESMMALHFELSNELQQLKGNDDEPPLTSELIDWNRISMTFMCDKHSANECKAMWKNYLHPSINKDKWMPEEEQKLIVLVDKFKCQDWESVAAALGTNRSAFTTCLHYFSQLCAKFKREKFSKEEDMELLRVVEACKIGSFIPWNKIVHHFKYRSRSQLYHRHHYFLSQAHVKKGRFTEAEDILLLILVDRFGKAFNKCAEYMPHRSQMQLKNRYSSNLRQSLKKGTWTAEEDQLIMQHVKTHGEKKWGDLTATLQRCRSQLRQRYLYIKDFLAKNPELSVTAVPKRKHIAFNSEDERYKFLRYMADQYKDCPTVPNVTMIEEAIEGASPNRPRSENEKREIKTYRRSANKRPAKDDKEVVKNLDSLLTEMFSNVMKVRMQKSLTPAHIEAATGNVRTMLRLLGVEKLNIPKCFENDDKLDEVDKEILRALAPEVSNDSGEVTSLVPPCLSTTIGLRSLLIRNRNYKSNGRDGCVFDLSDEARAAKDDSQIVWAMEQELSKLDEGARSAVLAHRELFSKRFNSLFTWSSILSLKEPCEEMVLCEDEEERETLEENTIVDLCQPSTSKRKVEVKKYQASTKKLKMNEEVNAKNLQPVQETVKFRKLDIAQTQNELKNGQRSTLFDLNAVEDIRANDASTSFGEEEFNALQNDVQLLGEIINYERHKNDLNACSKEYFKL